MRIYKLTASFLLPALAILAAALAQHIPTTVWPGIREIRSPAVTADGYFFLLCVALLCFLSGAVVRRHAGGRSGLVCALIAPSAFLCLLQWPLTLRPMLELGARIAWLRPITVFSIAAALLPLLAVVLGWAHSGARRPRLEPGS